MNFEVQVEDTSATLGLRVVLEQIQGRYGPTHSA